MTEVTDEIRGIKTQLDKVTGELKADVLDLRAQGSKASGRETTALKKQVTELQSEMREMKQQDQRKQNLVVFNMPESEAEDAENRKSHDKERFLHGSSRYHRDRCDPSAGVGPARTSRS